MAAGFILVCLSHFNSADDPTNPLKKATVGDNFRDNIEQVVVPAPVAGIYTLRISHKGSLNALQLITTPAPNSILPTGAQFQLLGGQSQAVSTCVSGNKDPSPLYPQLSQPAIINGNLYFDLKGHFGVHYKLEKSSDLVIWSEIPNLIFEVTTFPQAIGPISQGPNVSKSFYRVKSIPASQ